jgi:hypothetical protein
LPAIGKIYLLRSIRANSWSGWSIRWRCAACSYKCEIYGEGLTNNPDACTRQVSCLQNISACQLISRDQSVMRFHEILTFSSLASTIIYLDATTVHKIYLTPQLCIKYLLKKGFSPWNQLLWTQRVNMVQLQQSSTEYLEIISTDICASHELVVCPSATFVPKMSRRRDEISMHHVSCNSVIIHSRSEDIEISKAGKTVSVSPLIAATLCTYK